MSREIKTEHFFCTRADAIWHYDEHKHLNSMYNLISFTYLSDRGPLRYYLITTNTLMTVICNTYDYLGMLARYSINELGYEPADRGYFLAAVELMNF